MSVYRSIFKDAWKIVWRNPFLWLFGFFSSLMAVGVAGSALIITLGQLGQLPETGSMIMAWHSFYLPNVAPRFIGNLRKTLLGDTFSFSVFVILLLAVILLVILFVLLGVKSQSALISSVEKLRDNQKVIWLTELKSAGKSFWTVLLINLWVGIVSWALLIIVGPLATLILLDEKISLMLYALLFTAYFLVTLIVYLVGLFSINHAVLKNKGASDSLRQSAMIFAKNWLVSLEMALFILLFDIVGFLLISIVIFVLKIPFFMIIFILSSIGLQAGIYLSLLLAIILFAAIVTFANGWFTSFQLTAWTLLYLRITEQGAVSKLMRLIGQKE